MQLGEARLDQAVRSNPKEDSHDTAVVDYSSGAFVQWWGWPWIILWCSYLVGAIRR
jgi:hypothetical protein